MKRLNLFALCLLVFPLSARAVEPVLPPVTLDDLRWFPVREFKPMPPCFDEFCPDLWPELFAARSLFEFCRTQRRMRLAPQLPWQLWEDEAGVTASAWECLYEAADPMSLTCWRLDKLKRLREIIGWQAYYGGVMPDPHVLEFGPDVPMPEIEFDQE